MNNLTSNVTDLTVPSLLDLPEMVTVKPPDESDVLHTAELSVPRLQ